MNAVLNTNVLFVMIGVLPVGNVLGVAQEKSQNDLRARVVKIIDQDKDGEISRKELIQFIGKFDKNDNGTIDQTEIGKRPWAILKRLDANGEGKVARSELESRAGGRNKEGAVGKKPADFDHEYVYTRIGKKELRLYTYEPKLPSSKTRVPAIVFFHGGGWRGGNPSQFSKQCRYFRERGMVAITVEYRLIKNRSVKVDQCVEDAKSALRWVRGNAGKLGVDPKRIAAAGGSAGGHLAACTAVVDETHNSESDDLDVSAKPNALILFNPAMLLAPDDRMSAAEQEKTRNALAGRAKDDPKQISPLVHAKKKQPPCIMFFGTNDRLLKPAQWYRDDSVKAGNRCQIITYKGKGHGFFNSGESFADTLREADQFLVQLGWLARK